MFYRENNSTCLAIRYTMCMNFIYYLFYISPFHYFIYIYILLSPPFFLIFFVFVSQTLFIRKQTQEVKTLRHRKRCSKRENEKETRIRFMAREPFQFLGYFCKCIFSISLRRGGSCMYNVFACAKSNPLAAGE